MVGICVVKSVEILVIEYIIDKDVRKYMFCYMYFLNIILLFFFLYKEVDVLKGYVCWYI